MAWKKLLGALTATLLMVGLMGISAGPASAGHSSRSATITDAAGDGEFSTLCLFDDREPDFYTGIGGTGIQAANCDNKIAEVDFTSANLEYIPASDTRALFSPAGNDGAWGTSDDARGADGKVGTGDEPCTASSPYPTCNGGLPLLTTRVGTLAATINVSAPWPAPNFPTTLQASGSRNTENIAGMSALFEYRNADIQKNDLQATCDRSAPNLAGQPAYVYDERGVLHYEDGTYFHMWLSWEFSGPGNGPRADQQRWRPRINFGWYSPTIDEDTHWSFTAQTNLLYNPYNTGAAGSDAWTGLGRFYSWDWSNGNRTFTVKIPAIYVTINNNCKDQGTAPNQEPYNYLPFARTASEKSSLISLQTGQPLNPGNGQNDVLFDVFARTLVSVRPQTPVPIPTGSLIGAAVCPTVDSLPQVAIPLVGAVPPRCPGLLRNDIDWVIGLGFTADTWQFPDGSPGQVGGTHGTGLLLPPTLGPVDWPGPTCNTPTFGGNLPNNPLWNRGQPCAIRNPVNIGLRHNNNHIHVF